MDLTIDEQRKRLVRICDENKSCVACPIRIPCESINSMLMPWVKSDAEIEAMAKDVERMGLL